MFVSLAVAVKIALLSRNAAKQFMYTDLSVFPNFVTVRYLLISSDFNFASEAHFKSQSRVTLFASAGSTVAEIIYDASAELFSVAASSDIASFTPLSVTFVSFITDFSPFSAVFPQETIPANTKTTIKNKAISRLTACFIIFVLFI